MSDGAPELSYDLVHGEPKLVPVTRPRVRLARKRPEWSPKPGAKTWKLTEQEGKDIVRLAREYPGLSYAKIARFFDVDRGCVAKYAKRAGVRRNGRPSALTRGETEFAAYLVSEGLSLSQVASDMGVCRKTLRKALEALKR